MAGASPNLSTHLASCSVHREVGRNGLVALESRPIQATRGCMHTGEACPCLHGSAPLFPLLPADLHQENVRLLTRESM